VKEINFNLFYLISLQLFSSIIKKNWKLLAEVWVYILGPFCGGVLATIFFSFVTKPWMKKIKKIKEMNERA